MTIRIRSETEHPTFLSDGIAAGFFLALSFQHPKIRPIVNIYSLYTGNFKTVFCNLDSSILRKQKSLPEDKGVEYYIRFIFFLRGNKIIEQWGRIGYGVGVFSRCAALKLRNWWHEGRTFGWRSMHNSGFAGIRNGRVNARRAEPLNYPHQLCLPQTYCANTRSVNVLFCIDCDDCHY